LAEFMLVVQNTKEWQDSFMACQDVPQRTTRVQFPVGLPTGLCHCT
jgi:hypothetical protein